MTQKKNIRYVQTLEEMDQRADGPRPRRHEAARAAPPEAQRPSRRASRGRRLAKLMQVLDELEDSLVILERRGLNLADVPAAHARTASCRSIRVLLGGQEHWFFTPRRWTRSARRSSSGWAASWWSPTTTAGRRPTATATAAETFVRAGAARGPGDQPRPGEAARVRPRRRPT